ncbi:MAG TPA: ADP-glyceromanno-heptose 6-epimerase [Candidatus Kapabacteria bacterium]|nr:ADP-glyceromanno-heptose 6-epimerase [Candidatus Kapabacteria bacterium]HPO61688.1 ADP-glyceromanno-heptose 6-epimerase [Candidatus Kapabacteria bacterium]
MIIVTGGAGFIGSCFVKKLNDEGIKDIIIVDHLGNSEKWKNLVNKKYFDYIDKHVFIELLESGRLDELSIEAIFHFGACSVTTEKDADYMMDNNFQYSKILAMYSTEHNIKFIYASSAATYGAGENGYSDSVVQNFIPLNVYGYSKQAFDEWVEKNNLFKKFVGLKFFNVFGPNEYHKGSMASMVYKSYNQIKNEGKVKLFKSNSKDYKDGEQMRDFVYVKDVIDIIWEMYQKEITGLYNLGTGKARSWNDLAKAVFAAMELEPKIEYVDMPDELKEQYQNFTEADMKKLKKTKLNIKFNTLEDNVRDYVSNHLQKRWKNF